MLQPIVEAMMKAAGKPRAKVKVCKDPRFHGTSEALNWESIKQVLDRIVEKKIGYQPTIQVLYGELAYFEPDYLGTKSHAKVVPKEMLDWFETPEGKWFGKELNPGGITPAVLVQDYEQGVLRQVRQAVAYLASKDANFLFGTDTPSAPTYGNLPGLNGFLEMKQLEKAGMSLTQIFRAATINNAREFKIDSQIDRAGKDCQSCPHEEEPVGNDRRLRQHHHHFPARKANSARRPDSQSLKCRYD